MKFQSTFLAIFLAMASAVYAAEQCPEVNRTLQRRQQLIQVLTLVDFNRTKNTRPAVAPVRLLATLPLIRFAQWNVLRVVSA